MNFCKNNFFKKGWLLLITCTLYYVPGLNARSYEHTKSDKVISERAITYEEMYFPRNYDTVPKPGNKERSKGWEILFDGKHTDKWRSPGTDTFPSDGWTVEGGALCVKNHKKGADIITRGEYYNFELVFDFKLTHAANGGVKYFVEKIKNNSSGDMVWNGPEYQIIDEDNNPDFKNDNDPKGSTAALYLVYAPENKKLLPAGQWNSASIIVKGSHVSHWLNGVKVVSYERGTPDFRSRMAATKFKDYDNYGELPGGHIMLTNHDGDQVYFRNIKIKQFK